ncbi:hypothetical protein QBK99_17145 [Corticibacterium sp. UT-5YL-CI-8]|nr:hypothetical protein [Tianweitania sp. UT-5YL-CI-8]
MAQNYRDVANTWIAHVLGELYQQWPRRSDFNALDVATATGSSKGEEDPELFDDTIIWLRNNGYIRHSDQSSPDEGGWLEVELTEKSVLLLGKLPDSLQEPLGARMSKAAQAGASESGKAMIGSLVATLIETGIKSGLAG